MRVVRDVLREFKEELGDAGLMQEVIDVLKEDKNKKWRNRLDCRMLDIMAFLSGSGRYKDVA